MLFAGFNVSDGHYSLFAAVLVGDDREPVGSWIAYAIGYYGRIELLEKHGKKLHIKKAHLERADRWFEQPRRRDRLLRAHGADRAHVHLAARRRRADAVLALHASSPSSAACRGSSRSRSSASRPATTGTKWKDNLHYVDYAVLVADRRRRSSTCSSRRRGKAEARPTPEPDAADRLVRQAVALGRCRARRSCSRSRAAATSCWCRGCSTGPTPSSTTSCARRSRSRCTPAPPLALLIALRHEVGDALRGLDRRAVSRHVLTFAPPAVAASRSSGRSRSGSARPRGRSPPGRSRAGAALALADRAPAARAHARAPTARDALALGIAQACALCRACRATARRSRPRGCCASSARRPTRCRATPRCRSSSPRPG